MNDCEDMKAAQDGCAPCKLCGGNAIITDAGPGAGYYIKCGGSTTWRSWTGCLIDDRRVSGHARNVQNWWNRLMASDE